MRRIRSVRARDFRFQAVWYVLTPVRPDEFQQVRTRHPVAGFPRYYAVVRDEILYCPQPREGVTIEITEVEEPMGAGPEQNPFTEQYRAAYNAQMRVNQQAPFQSLPDNLVAWLQGAGRAGPDQRANRRARILLLRHMTLDQRRDWKRIGRFTVVGSRGTRFILNGREVIRESDSHTFCLQVVGEPVPLEDAILARKILIEADEAQFLATANDLSEPHRQRGTEEEGRLRGWLLNAAREARMLAGQRDADRDRATWRERLQQLMRDHT